VLGHRGPAVWADLVGKDLFLSSLLLSLPRPASRPVVPNIPWLAALTPLLLETCEAAGGRRTAIPLFASH